MKFYFFILLFFYSSIFSKTIIIKDIIPNDNKDDSIIINKTIKSMKKNDVLLLPNGILNIKNTIIINKNNITIKGSNNTILLLDLDNIKKYGILIQGKKIKRRLNYNSINNKNFYYYCIPNNIDNFLIDLNSTWNKKYPCLRSGINNKKNIILKNKKTYFQKIKMIENVKLINLIINTNKKIKKIERIYKNLYPQYLKPSVFIQYSNNIMLKNIKILNSGTNPLELEYVINSNFENIIINGSLNKGKKGNGYLRISKSHNNIFKNMIILNIRHIVLQWSSSFNLLKNIITNVDINFHGGNEHDNIVQNITYLDIKTHKWNKTTYTTNKVHWASPSGKNNIVIK